MIFPFGKKKDQPKDLKGSGKNSSLGAFESLDDPAMKILDPSEMAKLGGGKSSNKSKYDDDSFFQGTLGGTIPL